MEWTGSTRQLPPYNKFWTLPRHHVSHTYQDQQYISDVQHAPAFRQQQMYTQSFRECDGWTALSSSMGGALQDSTNWADQPVSYIPSALRSESHSKDYSEYQKQERERRKAEVQRARIQKLNESRRQIEEWRRRWEHKTPPYYKRDVKRSQSDASNLELEAWAARYSQSLPRKNHMDASIWGTIGAQRVQDRVKIPEGISRAGSNNAQRILHSPEQYNHIRGGGQRYNRQLMVPHNLPQSPILEKTWRRDRKENNPRLQQRVFNQPPQYIPPPPYGAPHIINHQANAYKYPTLPGPRKQEFHGALLKDREGYEKRNKTKWTDIDRSQEQVGNRTWKDHKASLKLPPEGFAQLVSPKHSELMAEPAKVVSSPSLATSETTSKKRGGEAVFCLVSRPQTVARLTSSPEEHLQPSSLQLLSDAPLTSKEYLGTDISKRGWIESISEWQAEVDSGVMQSKLLNEPPTYTANQSSPLKVDCTSRHCTIPSWLQDKRATLYREELVKVIQSRPRNIAGKPKNPTDRDETKVICSKVNVPLVMKKKTLQPCSPISKFPLWKEPSHMTSLRNKPSVRCIKSNLEQQSGSLNQYETETDSSRFINKRTAKQKEGTVSNRCDGVLVIDATCVVVRAEFIPPPKKEQVQYIYPPQGGDCEIFSGPNSAVSQHDLAISPQSFIMQCSKEVSPEIPLQELKSEDDQKLTSELSQSDRDAHVEDVRNTSSFSSATFENKSLVGRPLRILGVTVHKTNDKELNRDQTHVITHGKTQRLSVDVLPTKYETDITKDLKQLNSSGDTLSISNDQFLTDLGKNIDLQAMTLKQSIQNPSENDIRLSQSEKRDACGYEACHHEEPSLSPHTNHKASSRSGDVGLAHASICLHAAPSPPRVHSSSLYPSDSFEGANSVSNDQLLSDLDRATASEQKLRSNKEKEIHDIGHSMSDASEKYTVMNHADKQDISMSEDICSKEPFPFPHTKEEMANCTEGIPFSPPRFHSLSDQSLVLPSTSYSRSPSQFHTPHNLNLESLSDFPSLCLDTTEDTDRLSLCPPLCHPNTVSPNSEITVITPSLQTSQGQSLPCSLWDAVSRIRRHTAPDSDNEEEEAGETWDNQENMRKEAEINQALFDLGSSEKLEECSEIKSMLQSPEDLDLVENGSTSRTLDQNKERVSAVGADDLQVAENVSLSKNTGLNDIQQYENELQKQCEDDTLSWSSSDSHTSKDTVIMGQETQISEEVMPGARDYVS